MLSMFDLPITEAVYTFTDKDTATHIAASTLYGALEAFLKLLGGLGL